MNNENPVDVGGSSYTVRYNPNLSSEAREIIKDRVSKSSSGDSTDIYEIDAVHEGIEDGSLVFSENDILVINAITDGYIEIK